MDPPEPQGSAGLSDLTLSQARPWDLTAAGRNRWLGHLEDAYRPVSQRLLDLADVREGSKVLDVGTGFGEPALSAAWRAGPGGRVVGTDISPRLLDVAKDRAAEHGMTNIDFLMMDVQSLGFVDESFDSVISRLMLMFLSRLDEALSEIRRVLAGGGRFAAAVLGPPSRTPLVSLWEKALGGWGADGKAIHVRRGVPSSTWEIDPFCLSDCGLLGKRVARAGFSQVRTETAEAIFHFSCFDQFLDYLSDTREDVNATLQSQPQRNRTEILQRLRQAVRPHENAEGALRLISETNLVAATA